MAGLQVGLAQLAQLIAEGRPRSGLERDDAFVAWYLQAAGVVESRESALKALVGRSRDAGTDALHWQSEASVPTVYVVQGKYRQSPAPENRDSVIGLGTNGRRLVGDARKSFEALLGEAYPALRERLEIARRLVRVRDHKLELRFVTTGRVSDRIRESAASEVAGLLDVNFEIVDGADVLRIWQDDLTGAPLVPRFRIHSRGQVMERVDPQTRYRSVVFTAPAEEIGAVLTRYGPRLFARNIRGSLGDSPVNKEIAESLKAPASFWYLNNGITILCDRVVVDGGEVVVSNGNVINGQQTTRVFAKHKTRGALVLVKVISVPRGTDSERRDFTSFLGRAVRATNFQNPITLADLKANDEVQVGIERELRTLEHTYIRRRQSKSEAVSGPKGWPTVRKEEVAESLAACLLDPRVVPAGRDKLFADGTYRELFPRDRRAIEYLTYWWLAEVVLKSARSPKDKGERNRRSHPKWVVVNYMSARLSASLAIRSYQKAFVAMAMADRDFTRQNFVRPLRRAAVLLLGEALDWHADVNRDLDAKDQSDVAPFFKVSGRHKEFARRIRAIPRARRRPIDKALRDFHVNLAAAREELS